MLGTAPAAGGTDDVVSPINHLQLLNLVKEGKLSIASDATLSCEVRLIPIF